MSISGRYQTLEHLTQGQYFQFQLPQILADGTMVAQRLGGGTTTLLLLDDGDTRLVSVPTDFGLRFDDGTSLYGFSGEGRLLTRVDPYTGEPEQVDWFQTEPAPGSASKSAATSSPWNSSMHPVQLTCRGGSPTPAIP